jgi:hypothetical protein
MQHGRLALLFLLATINGCNVDADFEGPRAIPLAALYPHAPFERVKAFGEIPVSEPRWFACGSTDVLASFD